LSVLTLPNADRLALSVRAKALVFEDARSRALLERIRQVAPSQATVLITGETGTGKEIVARHLHELSRRSDKPFVAVNCGAFSESLAEAELFGHERGAFTGAQAAKAGWFETAHGGTLFLDEIGDLSLPLQVKLLRVLQEGEVVRIGSRQPTPIDVRLVTATNVDLRQAMAAGHFREDLFYRLNVTTLGLLPLRERPGDILPLCAYFLELYQRRLGVSATLGAAARARLLEHSWPGNIRELENAIHHALLVCQAGQIAPEDLGLPGSRHDVFRGAAPGPRGGSPDPSPSTPASTQLSDRAPSSLEAALIAMFDENLPDLHERVERTLLRAAYRYCHKNQLQTARLLGVSRNVVRARLIQFGELTGTLRTGAERTLAEVPPPERATSAPPSERRLSAPPSERRSSPAPALLPLRIGYQKFGLLGLVRLHGGLEAALERSGLRIEWREYAAGLPIVEALRLEEVELGVVGECPPVFALAAEVPLVYLAADPPAPEREAILVHSDSSIARVADLRGKTIALHRGANVHYLVIRALEEARLDYSEVELRYATPEVAKQWFERREVDAWAIWDPVLTSVRHELGARVLRNATGLAKNVTYYVGRRPFTERHPELVAEFLNQIALASAWARDNAAAVADLLGPQLSMPRGPLALALKGGTSPIPLNPELVRGQQQIADTLHRMQIIPRAIRVSEAQAHVEPLLAG
jgi:aliphatic sulfonates family ABC transporter substrate-binding protein